MTWDQTSLSPENFNILLKAGLVLVTLVKAFLGWNTKTHMCEHETLSLLVCTCRMMHSAALSVPFTYLLLLGMLSSASLPALGALSQSHIHFWVLPNQQHWSLKPLGFYLPLGVTTVHCMLLSGNIIVLVANMAYSYNSNPLSHHWYHNLVLMQFGEWGWTGENKPKVSVIAWVSETGRLKEVDVFISGTIKYTGFATFKSCLPDGSLSCCKLVSLMKT